MQSEVAIVSGLVAQAWMDETSARHALFPLGKDVQRASLGRTVVPRFQVCNSCGLRGWRGLNPLFTGGWKHPVREPGRDVGGHGMLDEIWRASPSLMRQLFQDYGGVHHPLVQMMAFPKAK